MTLLVSDEADLLEANLDYHLHRGVDFVLVTANRCPDGILEMLRPYEEREVVRVIREDAHTYAQAEWVTRMARLAATEHRADWVINCDVDEFYWPSGGSLNEVLSAIPEEYGSLEMPVFHFLPRPDDDRFFPDRLTVRETCSLKPTIPTAFSKVAHRASADIEVARGNHTVTGADLEQAPLWGLIVGLHFPIRSFAQYERKVIKDGRAVANNPDPSVANGVWRELLELHEAGRLRDEYDARVLSEEDVREGVRDGRLMVDERLKSFFASRTETSPPEAPDPERIERLRIELRRRIHESRCHPLAEVTRRLNKAERRLERAQRMLEKSERGRQRSERRQAQLKEALGAKGPYGTPVEGLRKAWRRTRRALAQRSAAPPDKRR